MPVTTLGLFSPGSPPRAESLAAGVRRLEEAGLSLRHGSTARPGEGLHAASPEARAADLHALLADPDVDAVLCTRGGSGSLGLLPLIDYDLARTASRPILGLSDVTALHLALYRHGGIRGVAGPVLVQLGADLPEYTWARWLESVRGPFRPGPVALPPEACLEALTGAPRGPAEGVLFPCNLSLLASLLGTNYLPSLEGAILVLEEIHETPQSLDRMMSALRLSGVDRGLAGVILGQFRDCVPRNPGVTEEDGRRVVLDWARSLRVPALRSFPFGHDPICCTLPFGTQARLTTSPPGLDLLEPPPTLAAS